MPTWSIEEPRAPEGARDRCAAASALAIRRALCFRPIATAARLRAATKLTASTVNKSLAHLEKLGIVTELTSKRHGRVFSYGR